MSVDCLTGKGQGQQSPIKEGNAAQGNTCGGSDGTIAEITKLPTIRNDNNSLQNVFSLH